MGANLTGMAEGGEKEATAQERTKGGASGVQQEAPHAKDQSPAPSDTACPEPQPVSTDKARTRRTKFRSVIGAIEDIQRMPEKAIYEEFNRLLMNSDPQLTPLGDPPCRDVAARLKTCLQRSRERSCNCFKVSPRPSLRT
ncbi:hypothetical protein KR074_005494 [Drosophila pseudoananassae]|nr:hypothetical protein KR074_005494 [Drosophila pseudoananassae]